MFFFPRIMKGFTHWSQYFNNFEILHAHIDLCFGNFRSNALVHPHYIAALNIIFFIVADLAFLGLIWNLFPPPGLSDGLFPVVTVFSAAPSGEQPTGWPADTHTDKQTDWRPAGRDVIQRRNMAAAGTQDGRFASLCDAIGPLYCKPLTWIHAIETVRSDLVGEVHRAIQKVSLFQSHAISINMDGNSFTLDMLTTFVDFSWEKYKATAAMVF